MPQRGRRRTEEGRMKRMGGGGRERDGIGWWEDENKTYNGTGHETVKNSP